MAISPPNDIAEYLEEESLGTVGTNLFVGPVRPKSAYVPVAAMFVASVSSGPAPVGVGGNPQSIRFPAVQIRIRHTTYATGQTLAQAVYDGLASADIEGYLYVRMEQAGPLFIGQDENGAYEWSINVSAWYDSRNVTFGDGAFWFDDEENSHQLLWLMHAND